MASAHHSHRSWPGNPRAWPASFQAPRNGGYWLRQSGAAPLPLRHRHHHCLREDCARGHPVGKGHRTARGCPPSGTTSPPAVNSNPDLPPAPMADTIPEVRVPSPVRPFPALGACSASSFSGGRSSSFRHFSWAPGSICTSLPPLPHSGNLSLVFLGRGMFPPSTRRLLGPLALSRAVYLSRSSPGFCVLALVPEAIGSFWALALSFWSLSPRPLA